MENGVAQFSLTCQNNSANTGSFVIFQQLPGAVPNILSLAWFARVAAPTTRVKFAWNTDYSFVWSETGELAPGVDFNASQIWPADLSRSNQVTFTNAGGIPTFTNQTAGHAPGGFTIVSDGTVPANTFGVGLGMGGAALFTAQAQPNWNMVFTPRPQYWLAFGNYMQGEVLDVEAISNAVRIDYPANIYSMAATLNQDNTWTVGNLPKFNRQLLAARARLKELA
jgi:rhizosphere induced protein